jgi:Uma2 family endonuclease
MQRAARKPLPGTTIDPLYPDSDGRPMGDTDFHSYALRWLWDALQDFFAGLDFYIAMNLLMYYEQGNPKGRRDPDILVAKGVGAHKRRSFRFWEENKKPCTLFEITSKRTWREDTGEKRTLYEQLGIPEYFLFDPEGKYLKPALQGFRLSKGKYVALKLDADGSLMSKQLGLRLVPEGEMLRLVDARTGKPVPTRAERAEKEKQQALKEKRQALKEKQRADQLAQENERLRALLARQNGSEE